MRFSVQAFLASTVLVAAAEIGDKTQLLSFVLAARLRRPFPIAAGILIATLGNHILVGTVGVWLADMLPQSVLYWIVGLSFVAFGFWTLRPDSLEDDPRIHKSGAFVTTVIAFFLAEMGDKTQFATIALAARFHALAAVVAGSTLGMMIANVPAVWIGGALASRIPMQAVRLTAAGLFLGIGAATLLGPIELAAR